MFCFHSHDIFPIFSKIFCTPFLFFFSVNNLIFFCLFLHFTQFLFLGFDFPPFQTFFFFLFLLYHSKVFSCTQKRNWCVFSFGRVYFIFRHNYNGYWRLWWSSSFYSTNFIGWLLFFLCFTCGYTKIMWCFYYLMETFL